jgi:hypothetical protein
MKIPISLRGPAAALVLLTAAAQPAWADAYSDSYNQLFGPGYVLPLPGCCTWNQNTIGWYWTPQQTVSLTTIETILVNVLFGVNDDFDLTVTLFTDRPAVGGIALASATFNPGQFFPDDPPWHGKAFATPVTVTSGTEYFVGFSGWDNSQVDGARGGINWVIQPDVPDGLPPGVQFLSMAYILDDFSLGIGTASSVTAAPVIKFVGDTTLPVPEPSVWALWTLGLLGVAAARRRQTTNAA